MRRADRLFQIVQLLRGGRVRTASELAGELEVSPRTVYRDVSDLVASGVPIDGEAGVGYCMPRGFDLPPLMFDEEEVGALVLGARMVQAWGDATLARRARGVLSKVESILPERLRRRMEELELHVPISLPEELRESVRTLRLGINERRKVRFEYVDSKGEGTRRSVRPIFLTFWGTVWTLSAWCELREDFRTFRPDRMTDLELLEETFADEPGRTGEDFLERVWKGLRPGADPGPDRVR